jgi:hypothetical protein
LSVYIIDEPSYISRLKLGSAEYPVPKCTVPVSNNLLFVDAGMIVAVRPVDVPLPFVLDVMLVLVLKLLDTTCNTLPLGNPALVTADRD